VSVEEADEVARAESAAGSELVRAWVPLPDDDVVFLPSGFVARADH